MKWISFIFSLALVSLSSCAHSTFQSRNPSSDEFYMTKALAMGDIGALPTEGIQPLSKERGQQIIREGKDRYFLNGNSVNFITAGNADEGRTATYTFAYSNRVDGHSLLLLRSTAKEAFNDYYFDVGSSPGVGYARGRCIAIPTMRTEPGALRVVILESEDASKKSGADFILRAYLADTNSLNNKIGSMADASSPLGALCSEDPTVQSTRVKSVLGEVAKPYWEIHQVLGGK